MSRQRYRVKLCTHGYAPARIWEDPLSPHGLRISMWCPACKLLEHRFAECLQHACDLAHHHARTCPALRAANSAPAIPRETVFEKWRWRA